MNRHHDPPQQSRRITERSFAVLGAALAALIVAGLVLDVRAVDQTRGGYEPAYTDYTGMPIDWDALDVTATGMAYRGYVVNILVNCTSGMMTFEMFKAEIPFRKFSPRALVVHRPREACEQRGFAPQFLSGSATRAPSPR